MLVSSTGTLVDFENLISYLESAVTQTLYLLSYHPSLAHFIHLFRSRCAVKKPFAKKFSSSSYLLHSFPRNFLAGVCVVLKKSVSKSAIFWHSFWPLWILLIHSRLLFHSGPGNNLNKKYPKIGYFLDLWKLILFRVFSFHVRKKICKSIF